MSYLNLLSVFPQPNILLAIVLGKKRSILLTQFFLLSYDVLTAITPTLLLFYYILLLYLFILLSRGDNLLLTL